MMKKEEAEAEAEEEGERKNGTLVSINSELSSDSRLLHKP